ncbi:ATP-binding protein [Bacillus mycoides]|uniref:ATP-binding protein n=1 Tax=Bacillus mycoides TaxID=1405 RepID=UPI003D64F840
MKNQYNLPCPVCGDKTAGGLFYRIFNQQVWIPAGKMMNCPDCREREAFKAYQDRSLQELKTSVGERLAKEYYLPPESLMNAGFSNYQETDNIAAGVKGKAILFTKSFLEFKKDYYNLLIMGNPGTGKTHLCVAIARNIKQKGLTVGFITTAVGKRVYSRFHDNTQFIDLFTEDY